MSVLIGLIVNVVSLINWWLIQQMYFILIVPYFNHASEIGTCQAMVQNQGGTGIITNIQDEYDDLVISNIELTTSDEADDNYCLMFVRNKQERFLTLNDKAKSDIAMVTRLLLSSEVSSTIPSSTSTNIFWENAITPSTVIGAFIKVS